MNKFWIEDPSTLFSEKTYISIIPTNDMNLNEKLNSITILCIYYIIIGFIFNFNDIYIYTAFSVIILIIIVYNINNSNKLDINNIDINKIFNKEDIEKLSKDLSPVFEKNILNKYNNISEYNKLENISSNKCNLNINQSNNQSESINQSNNQSNNQSESIDQSNNQSESINNIVNINCKNPTKDNPLMNINIGDNPNNPLPCIHTDEIKEDINSKFNYNLYRDTDDLFERFNSQRQFYTTPNTSVPNDQTKFAEWLYKIPQTCKETSLCLKNEDKRFYK